MLARANMHTDTDTCALYPTHEILQAGKMLGQNACIYPLLSRGKRLRVRKTLFLAQRLQHVKDASSGCDYSSLGTVASEQIELENHEAKQQSGNNKK